MAKARRKMRRALMKKMRKGALTPGERRDLMELDREVNRANRQAAGVGGAGLAAALAIASKTGALGKGKDALGDFLDERAGMREERKGQRAIEKEEKREAKERAEDEADLSRRAAAAERSGERAAERELKELRKAQGEYEEMLDDEARAEEKELKELRKAAEKEQLENERLDKKLKKHGGFDPRTGEYVDSDKQKAEDERFDKEFDEFPDKEDAEDEIAERIEDLRESGMSDREIFEKLEKEGKLPGSITGDSAVAGGYRWIPYQGAYYTESDDPFASSSPTAMMRQIRKNERIENREERKEKKKNDRIQKQIDFVNKHGGFNPLTGEYVDSAKQRAADEEFDREFDQAFPDEEVLAEGQAIIDRAMPNLSASNREGWRVPSGIPLADQAGPRAEEGEEMPDPDRPVMTRQGMDLDTMIRLGGRGGSEEDREAEREAGLAASLSDYSPEEIEALIRYDLRQADGGTTPFLRKMRDRIRKKFR